MNWKEQLWAHFSELILFALLVIVGLGHHSIVTRVPQDPEAVRWIEGLIGQILAALLTLLVATRKATP